MAYPLSARPARQDPNAPAAAELTLRIPGQPGRAARYEGLIVGGSAVLAFVAIWQFVAFRRLMPELFLPGPADIAVAFGAYIGKGQIWNDLWVSGQELLLGFVLAIVVGLPLGMLMGWYRRLNKALDPFVTFFNAIPRVSLTPLFIIWFGIGINSKIAVVFLGALFAILINAAVGVRHLDPALVKAARAFGASDIPLLRTSVLRARSVSGLWGPAAPLGPVVAPLVPRCALLPAPTPRLRTRFARWPWACAQPDGLRH